MAIKFLSGLNLSNVTAGSLLKLDSNGNIVAATAGTDYLGSSEWSTAGQGGVNINKDVRIGIFSSDVLPEARLHVYEYQTTDPKILIEDGNTGDASMQFKISTQSYTMGIDNSDSDKFILATTSGFGLAANTHALEISTTGKVTIPAFSTQGSVRFEVASYNRLRVHGVDLLGYNGDHLWVIGNNTTNTINLGASWDWDQQIAISYTPGTTGQYNGVLSFGQTEKNNTDWTHGVTRFYTSGAERVRFDSAGNVGIGTTSPNQLLHVNGNLRIGPYYSDNDRDGFLFTPGGVLNTIQANNENTNFDNNQGNIHIRTGNNSSASPTERISVLSTGNVGIGTTSPLSGLHVNKENASSVLTISRGGTDLPVSTDIGEIEFKADYSGSPISYGGIKMSSNSISGVRSSLMFNVKSTSGSIQTGLTVQGNTATPNVGVGTSSPSAKLHVYGPGGSGVVTQIKVSQADDGAGHPGADAILQSSGWGEAFLKLSGHQISASNGDMNVTSASDLALQTGGNNTRMFITNTGNVGIGTTDPTSTLHVGGLQANSSATSVSNPTGTLRLGYAGGEGSNNLGASLVFTQEWYSSSTAQIAMGQITGYKQGGNGTYGGGLTFWTANENTNALAERMRIDKSGNVGVGTTSPSTKFSVRATTATHQLVGINRANSDTAALYLGNNSSDDAIIAANNGDLSLGKDVSGTYTEYVNIATDGELKFSAYGAGILKTNASGIVSVDTSTYVTDVDWSDIDSINGIININSTTQIGQGDTETLVSFQNSGTERGRFEVDDSANSYFVATGFKTATASTGFLKADGTVDTDDFFSGAYSDLTGKPTLGTAAATASTAYATAAQGTTADAALPKAGGTMTGVLKLDSELQFLRGAGSGEYSNYIRAANYPSENYTSSTAKYWLEYGAKGGHHFVLNTDGGAGTAENAMDDFTIWNGAVDGDRLLEVTNAGNVTMAGKLRIDTRLQIGDDTSSSTDYIYDGYLDANSAYFHQPKVIIRSDSSATGGLDEAPVALAMFNRNGTNNTWVKMSFASREVNGAGNTVSIAGIAAQKTTGTSGSWASGKLYLWTKSGASFVENMVLQPNGNVGVGTSSPSYKLDVAGTIRSGTGYRTSINGDASGAVVLFGSSSDNDSLGVIGAYASLFNISSGNGDISFQFNSTERMRLNSTGNLGIGTTSPGGRLELNGSGQSWATAPAIRMWDSFNSKGWIVGSANNVTAGDFYIRTLPGEDTNPAPANQKEFVIKHSTGNVGINNLSPSYKLHVNGDIGIDSSNALIFDGNNSVGQSYVKSGGNLNLIIDSNNNQATAALIVEKDTQTAGSGTELFRVQEDGNVGIGDASPSQKLSVAGDISATDQISVNNRTAISVAHWSASGNSTGSIKITVPGSHTSNWSMLVLRITAYEYNSTAHTIYYVSGHDWTSGWYNNGVTKIGNSSKDIKLGYDSNKDYVLLGLTTASWSYGHVTVDVMAHPGFYNGNMDITSGWDIRQTTDLSGITTQAVTNKRVLTTSDEGSGNGIDADTVDGIQAASFLRSDADDTASGNITFSDNAKVILGSGSDFEMFHNGSNTFLQTTSSSVGDLYVTARGTNHDLYLEAADDIFIRPQGNESGIDVIGNGAVKLYYDGAVRLETTEDGINVPGVAQLGATNFYFHDVGVGDADGLDIKWTLKNPSGNDVTATEAATVYRLRLVTLGTGTNTGAVYICDNVDGNGWRVKKVSSVDGGAPNSNYPFVEIDNQVPKVTIQHSSTYNVRVIIEAFYGGNGGASYEMLGLDSGITNENGSVLMSLSSSTTEATSVMIGTDNILRKRALGSLAFNSTTLGTAASSAATDFVAVSGDTMTGDLTISNNNLSGLKVTGNNGTYTSAVIANTGSGAATLWFDAANGDLAGSDYAWVRQNNNLDFEIGVDSLGGDLSFIEGGSERMRISSGNVGIGTTSPSTKLEVAGEAKVTSLLISDSASGLLKGHGDAYHGIMFRGTPAAATTYGITAGDQISFYEYGGEFRFYQKNNTGGGVLNEVARIHHTNSFFNSKVGIGTASPGFKLEVNGTTRLGDTAANYTRFGTYGALLSTDTHILHNMLWTGSWTQIDATKSSSTIYMGSSANNTIKFGYAGTNDTSWSYNHTFENDGDYTAAGVIKGQGSIRVDAAATGSPYFGLYQDGGERAYLQYVDSGDNLVMQSDGQVTIRGDVQHGQGDTDAVISFNQSTNELGKFDQDGYIYATGFKTSTAATGFLKADGSVDTNTYAASGHNHDSDYVSILGGYYDADFAWDGTHDFQDEIKVSGASATTTNTTALFYGTGGLVEKRALGTAAFSATGDFAAASHTHSYLPLAGGTLTGDLIINTGTTGSTTQAYSAFDSLQFNNQYSSVAAGPNKIVMYDDGGSWVGGFGIHDDTTAYYSGGTHKWYKTATGPGGPTFTQKMSLDGSGNLAVTGTLTATGGTLSGALTLSSGDLTVPGYIRHYGDTDTHLVFTTNRVQIVAGGTTKFDSNNTYLTSYTETDTLATVTGRGASTTTTLSVRNVTSRTIIPEADRTYNLGAEGTRWAIVYCETLDSAGQHESNLQDEENPIGQHKTGTVLSWKDGKNRPCTQFADHMRMGIAVEGQDSPLIQGAEPVLVTGTVEEGDYLVTSRKVGHAEALPRHLVIQQQLMDCVIGKALENGEGDSHLIKTWINI